MNLRLPRPAILLWLLCGFSSFVLLASSALANVSLSNSQTFPSVTTVGQTDLAASVSLTNTSTAPNALGDMTITGITLTPGCGSPGSAGLPCASPDPNVFSYATAVGRAGTAFAGLTFTFSLISASTGEVQLVPSAPTMLGPPGSATATGVIDFKFGVLKSPTIDVQPAMPGVQTYHLARASGTKDNLTVNTKSSALVTVAKAQTTLGAATQGTVRLGNSISSAATLSGGFSPTGTITFSLFGPNNDTCGGSAIFTSIKDVSANGTIPSDPYAPSAPGIYRWVVAYSGDANNNGASRGCNASGNNVRVIFLEVLSIQKAGNSVTIIFRGVPADVYQVQYRDALNAGPWATFPPSFVADASGNFTFNESTALPLRFYQGIVP